MVWSPEKAMKAYLHTLKLFNSHNHDCTLKKKNSTTSIPDCMEFISAMAAGNRAQLILEITSEGISLITIALAVAANQTGGRLICILPPVHQDIIKEGKTLIQSYDLDQDIIEFVATENPYEMIKKYKNIDFAVIDCKVENHLKLFEVMDLNKQNGLSSVVVMRNVGELNRGRDSYGEVFKGKGGFESVNNLVIGEGLELMRLSSSSSCYSDKFESRKFRRFFMTIES